jgi:uncharacterized membrane protein
MTDADFYKDQLIFVLLYITILNVILVPVCFIPLGFYSWRRVLGGIILGLLWFISLPVIIVERFADIPTIKKGKIEE